MVRFWYEVDKSGLLIWELPWQPGNFKYSEKSAFRLLTLVEEGNIFFTFLDTKSCIFERSTKNEFEWKRVAFRFEAIFRRQTYVKIWVRFCLKLFFGGAANLKSINLFAVRGKWKREFFLKLYFLNIALGTRLSMSMKPSYCTGCITIHYW